MSLRKSALRLGLVLLSATFCVAGTLKARAPLEFAEAVFHFQILPWTPSLIVAFCLPWLELVSGLALLSPGFRRPALWILTALCTTFLFALVSAKLRGLDIDCGCFGTARSSTSLGWDIARATALTVVTAACLWLERPSPSS